jgi:hypothetical protein
MTRLGSLHPTSVDPESLAFRRGSFKLRSFQNHSRSTLSTRATAPRGRSARESATRRATGRSRHAVFPVADLRSRAAMVVLPVADPPAAGIRARHADSRSTHSAARTPTDVHWGVASARQSRIRNHAGRCFVPMRSLPCISACHRITRDRHARPRPRPSPRCSVASAPRAPARGGRVDTR